MSLIETEILTESSRGMQNDKEAHTAHTAYSILLLLMQQLIVLMMIDN